ncbi:hypothetical protein CBUD_2141a [Coxiella burnetii Dugway 5J108-111]|uniref:Uncharacterized protein n=1 Tax=Coxiella burnetii (strain Dugway 5J108-111) TaxID=434922 RepID=B5XHL6_COXBN|nr:hypothetical protein CBUD_2141a [Coxiella burnetii Dugway 5J108-111]
MKLRLIENPTQNRKIYTKIYFFNRHSRKGGNPARFSALRTQCAGSPPARGRQWVLEIKTDRKKLK